ncbi:MAG: hypothetical protein EBS68_15585, partial [Rhodobacteraceae bacterium]|nr:hypothetical protein [Paracoccaceae bacterium]
MSKQYEFVKAPQRSPEWLELRRQGLGASDMAAVMGVSPYKTPYQLWAEKTGATPPQKVGAAAQRGVILEDAVGRYYEEERGVKLVFVDAQADAQKQMSQVENFIAQKVDAIILNPCEFEASTPAVDLIRSAGIPLVLVNQVTKSPGNAYVGSNDVEAGRLAMEAVARKLNGQGGVLMIHGIMGTSAQLQREAGARQVFAKYPGLKLIDHQTASWDRAKAMALTENWIQAHKGKFQAIFAHNDEMAMGALLAQSSCPAVLMYSKDPSARTTRESPDYPDVVAQVRTFFQERLQLAAELGIRQENLMLDPGLGFFVSGNPSFSFELLRRLPELATLGCSLLVGTSRKSFLAGVLPGHHLAPSERRVPSLTAALWAWLHGAQVVRVHDVDETILMRATLQALQGK